MFEFNWFKHADLHNLHIYGRMVKLKNVQNFAALRFNKQQIVRAYL